MKRIYIAAPLFDEMELQRNLEIATMLEEIGHKVYLPQRDSGEAATGADRMGLYLDDVKGIRNCDILLALLDGRVPDEGTCFEVGMAVAQYKPVISYLTDKRSFMSGHLNVMLEYGSSRILHNREELLECFGGL